VIACTRMLIASPSHYNLMNRLAMYFEEADEPQEPEVIPEEGEGSVDRRRG